jgi:hypothetical protein
MGLWGKSITTIGSRLAHRSSQGRQVMKAFAWSLLADARGKYGKITWYRIFRTILLTRYFVCNLMWHGRATTMQCSSKSDVMHMFMKTRCICSGSMVLMMHASMTRLPTKRVSEWDDKHRLRRGVRGESQFTTKIPSALLVAIMGLQRTWRPRFRHGTFSYGITTSPNTRDRVEDIENTPCVCTLVHPRFPNAHAMQMHAQEET